MYAFRLLILIGLRSNHLTNNFNLFLTSLSVWKAQATKDIAQFLKKLNFKSQDAVVSEESGSEDDEEKVKDVAKPSISSSTSKKPTLQTGSSAINGEASSVKKQLAAVKLVWFPHQ